MPRYDVGCSIMSTGASESNGAAPWTSLPQSFRTAAAQSANAVLLETSRFDPGNRHSHLFLNPRHLIVANQLGEIPRLFAELETALREGLYVAGFLSYECGYHFE